MNRILLVLLLFAAALSGCSKTANNQDAVNAQLSIDTKIITGYLKDNNIAATEVDSSGVNTGIYYVVNTAGNGSNLYTSSTLVTMSYTGTVLNTNGTLGTVFAQTTTATSDFHPSFVLGSVIRGWQLGLPAAKVGVGGTVTLYVPSKYAYGPYAQPQIGLQANAVTIFTITIFNITN
jgi:FKBP-type peptidyl-prolyl cis-trans isomerase FkpA